MASPLLLYLKYHKILQPETKVSEGSQLQRKPLLGPSPCWKCLQTLSHLNSVDIDLGHLSAKKIIWSGRYTAGVDCLGVQEGLTPDGCSDWADVRESSSAWFRMVHAASAAPRTTPRPQCPSVRTRADSSRRYTTYYNTAGRGQGNFGMGINLIVTKLHCLCT